MIDTHAHVHSRAFDSDRAEVMRRVWESGGRNMIEVNISAADWPRVRDLASTDPRIYAAIGIHPHEASREGAEHLDRLFTEIAHPKVRAIGETGLDYYRNYAPHDLQRDLFRRHVAKARTTGLALVVHSRAAHDDTLRIIEEEGRRDVFGVMHCFSGDESVAKSAFDLGFLIGLGGSVTYSIGRATPIVRLAGLGRIVLETDCPYLTPAPRRNDRNEPSSIPVIAAAVAGILGVDVDAVERATDANAIRLFDLPE
jgi:TatD DNase family protein